MKLKVKANGPELLIDPETNEMIDVSKSEFEKGNRKTFTVTDSMFWRKMIMNGRLDQVQSMGRKPKEESPDEK